MKIIKQDKGKKIITKGNEMRDLFKVVTYLNNQSFIRKEW